LYVEKDDHAFAQLKQFVAEKTPHGVEAQAKHGDFVALRRDILQWCDALLRVPAKIRFLSLEPLIGPLDDLPLEGIDWVIVGGESGPRARPMRREWVNSILRQCRKAGAAFFFKQWGGVRKDLTGRSLNGTVYDEMPDRAPVPSPIAA